ncbi:MAG: hypothetical protein A2542_01665 [Parcubacteria group bacterium RIFOXYD2_FULL_52_8]|nr:MAG: hypothetical protein A2542_01665 [Parcubacteria group bacterium RIFOXYD2_FULL_52_8]
MEESRQTTSVSASPFLTAPMAILLAGIIIAGAVIYTGGGGMLALSGNQNLGQAAPSPVNDQAKNIKPVTNDDHILGDPNASIKIVEFSDTECPFCKRFHFLTMAKIMEAYAEKGDVAWVYRHAPLDSLHTKARVEAEATECAASLGGNDKFWAYLNELMTVTPTNDGLDLAELPKIASRVGLDAKKFIACQERHESKDKIQAQLQDAIDAGLSGTPYSVIVAKNGKKYPIEGAQDFETVKAMVEVALKQN